MSTGSTERLSLALNHEYKPKNRYNYDFAGTEYITPKIPIGEAILFTGREEKSGSSDRKKEL